MIDRRIKIRHLEAFVEIAREKRLKTAAEKLALSQPSISKTLKELEDILGAPLMTRDRAGVTLNRYGEIFLRAAKASLASLRQGVDGIERERNSAPQTVVIGALPSVAAWLMPLVARELHRHAPQIRLRIVDGPHEYLLNRLSLGDVDFVIGRFSDPDAMKAVQFNQLYDEQVDIVVRPDHPLLARPMLQNLTDYQVIFPPEGSAIRMLVDRFLLSQGITDIQNRLETVSGAFGRVYTQTTDAVWFISRGVVTNEIADGRLVCLPIDTSDTRGAVGLMRRVSAERTDAQAAIERVIKSVVAAHFAALG